MASSVCLIDGCTAPVHVKKHGLCRLHYYRGWRAGALNEKRKYQHIQEYEIRTCLSCGESFRNRRSKKMCSKACENRFYRIENTAKSCTVEGCERPLVAKGLCATHWRRKARADGREKARAWDESRKAHWKRREAVKRGASTSEVFTSQAVYERDGWVCGLCNQRIDNSVKWPNALSASVDHILPLSLGGHHTLENVQAAHLGCNISKGNRTEKARG